MENMMLPTGTILKNETGSAGTTFYSVVSVAKTSYMSLFI